MLPVVLVRKNESKSEVKEVEVSGPVAEMLSTGWLPKEVAEKIKKLEHKLEEAEMFKNALYERADEETLAHMHQLITEIEKYECHDYMCECENKWWKWRICSVCSKCDCDFDLKEEGWTYDEDAEEWGCPEHEKAEYEDVYNCGDANKDAQPQIFKEVKGSSWPEFNEFKYYQTYGGGPEGGYITDGIKLAKVDRDCGAPWSVEVVNGTLTFRAGDDKVGRPNEVKVLIHP